MRCSCPTGCLSPTPASRSPPPTPRGPAGRRGAPPTYGWIERAGKLAVRFFGQAPHALFLPDGLLIAHAGFPLTDLHAKLEETGDWNDPACLSEFTWTRAHPTARKTD